MSGQLGYPAPPQAAAVQDENGQMAQAWTEYLGALATRPSTVPPAVTNSITAASTAATTAGTQAAAAQAATNRLALQLSALTTIWAVGDYRQTAIADLGPAWLRCDGRTLQQSAYPALAALLVPHPAPGVTTFILPDLPASMDPNDPTVTVSATWVRAQ